MKTFFSRTIYALAFLCLSLADLQEIHEELFAFVSENIHTELGRYQSLRSGIQMQYRWTDEYYTRAAAVRATEQQLFELYLVLNETTEEEAIQVLLEEKQSLRAELAEQWESFIAAKNAALVTRNEQVDQLLTKNETLPTNSIFTENEQLINELYLSSVAIDAFELDEAALERLQTIAEQCSMEGGKVVYRARALYQLFTGRTFIDECNQEEEWEGNTHQVILEDLVLENDSGSIQVYPNPTREYLQIALPEKLTQQATQATLYSVQGQLIQSWLLGASTSQRLNTQVIPTGIYWLTISTDSEPLFSQRVVILP